jgi:outer membrane lipoprotein carrier protein
MDAFRCDLERVSRPPEVPRTPRAPKGILSWILSVAILAILLAPRPIFAGDAIPGEKAILGTERERWFEEIRERQKKVTGMTAVVVQRKRHPLLKDEAVSRGKLFFRKPALLRWELESPEKMVLVMDGRKVTTYFPTRKEAERKDLRDDPSSRYMLEFFESGISAPLPELERRFHVALFRSDNEMILQLIPRSRMVLRAVASIRIYQDPVEGRPRRILVDGPRGDRTETTFSEVTFNPGFPPDTFALRLGTEVRVTETGVPGVSSDTP